LENGKTALVDFLTEGEYGWGSTEFIVFGPKKPLNPWFVYCLARNQEFREHAIRAMSGTSGRQRVEIGCFNSFPIVIPPAEIAVTFGDTVSPWFSQMKMNDEQSATLNVIRDALLPKLLSGEIRVKDAERFVERNV
jgi:type I restriction enzyme S subunit